MGMCVDMCIDSNGSIDNRCRNHLSTPVALGIRMILCMSILMYIHIDPHALGTHLCRINLCFIGHGLPSSARHDIPCPSTCVCMLACRCVGVSAHTCRPECERAGGKRVCRQVGGQAGLKMPVCACICPGSVRLFTLPSDLRVSFCFEQPCMSVCPSVHASLCAHARPSLRVSVRLCVLARIHTSVSACVHTLVRSSIRPPAAHPQNKQARRPTHPPTNKQTHRPADPPMHPLTNQPANPPARWPTIPSCTSIRPSVRPSMRASKWDGRQDGDCRWSVRSTARWNVQITARWNARITAWQNGRSTILNG